MEKYSRRPQLANLRETYLAEDTLSGHQCTLEGYVYEGDIVNFGIIDTVHEGKRSHVDPGRRQLQF